MAEYIEREAVKKALHDNTTEMEQSIAYSSNIGVPEEDIEYVIDEIPAADVVAVVHASWVWGKVCGSKGYCCTNCGAGFVGENAAQKWTVINNGSKGR